MPIIESQRATRSSARSAPPRGWLDGWRHRLGSWLAARLAPATQASPDPWFLALFDQSADGLLVCDADGLVLACNAEAARQLGLAADAVVGQPLRRWIVQGSKSRRGAAAAQAPGLAVVDGPARLHPHPAMAGAMAAPAAGGNAAPDSAPDASRGGLAVELRVTAMRTAAGAHCIVQVRDAGDSAQAAADLAYLANYDTLTGLPNRLLFHDRLAQAMHRARRTNKPMALMFLDLDRFKLVNDSLGHEVGDRLLKHVATTLTACMRDVDSVVRLVDQEGFTLSRLGGDEFTLIAESIEGAEDAALIARRLLEALHAPFKAGEEEIIVSASIGIALFPTDDVDRDGLIRHADMAMYRSKSLGRGTYSFFSEDLNAAAAARLSLEGGLRRAIERGEFQLHYQPKADLYTGEVTGVEALLRWHCPGQGMVPPDRFITVLEETGMILPVGAWVMRAACAQLAEWDRQGLPALRLAVNLSARQLRHPHLAAMLTDTLRENYIHPARFEVELTESLLMEDNETNRGLLENLAQMGVRLAIDDFGTGHSSLSYLKRFNVDTLKIDRSFVQSLPGSTEDVAISTAVIALGHSMQMRVVAEGVETDAQAALLRELGCDEMQGYLLGRPMPPHELSTWLRQRLRNAWRDEQHLGRAVEPITLLHLAADMAEDAPA